MASGSRVLIQREVEFAKAGREARIVAKMNGLEDPGMIEALYEASRAGVQIDLLVRGLCALRPGLPGVSERIRVVSLVGRLLEHSRIFFFQNGASDPLQGTFYIGSADWMGRNLHRRIEVVTPVEDRVVREQLWRILEVGLNAYAMSWEMRSDGSYVRRSMPEGVSTTANLGTHDYFFTRFIRQTPTVN